jgi:hypothetical protein
MTRRNSLLKVFLLLGIDGSRLLKIHEFLLDQMLQHMMIIMSMANGRPIIVLILLTALFGYNQVGMLIPIYCQQFFAKGHLKNKCQTLSSLCLMHISHT